MQELLTNFQIDAFCLLAAYHLCPLLINRVNSSHSRLTFLHIITGTGSAIMEFKSTPLFGGALRCDLPSTFADVSEIRQVPDHQEVWLDKNGFTNIIVEINQRVSTEEAPTDEDALRFHFKDLAESSAASAADETKFWASGSAVLSKLPGVPAYTLFATQHNAKKTKKNPEDFTGVLMMLIRLEKQESDVLICVNVPHVPGHYNNADIDLPAQKVGELLDKGGVIRQKVLETFEVKDWSVFGDD